MGGPVSEDRQTDIMVKDRKNDEPRSVECTINIHKRIHRVGFKRRAPRAVEDLKKFMWSKGIKNVPYRVRVKISKKRNESDKNPEKWFLTVEHVPVAGNYKKLQTITVDE